MSRFRQLCAAIVLTLALALSALAGDMNSPPTVGPGDADPGIIHVPGLAAPGDSHTPGDADPGIIHTPGEATPGEGHTPGAAMRGTDFTAMLMFALQSILF